jgi:thiol-disulfide isomerase/thioredoxin
MTNLPSSPNASGAKSSVPWWLLLALGVAVVLLLTSRGRSPSHNFGSPDQKGIGEKFLGWQLQPLTGDSHPLSSQETQGHVVLMNFWGTWCPPCRAEFPHIAELARRFSTNPELVVAAVSCGGDGNDSRLEPLREETAQFLDRVKSELPTYADQDAITRQKLMSLIQFDGYPTTVVLDRDGTIRGVWVGYEPGTEKKMERLVDELLLARPEAGK